MCLNVQILGFLEVSVGTFGMDITTTFEPQIGDGSCKRGIEWYAFPSIVYILGACHYGVAIIGISINLLAMAKYFYLFKKKSLRKQLAIASISTALLWLLALVGFTLNWHVSCVFGDPNNSISYTLSMGLAGYPDMFGYICFYKLISFN